MIDTLPKTLLEAAVAILERHQYQDIVLTEDRIDFLKAKHPEIDSSHDSLAKHRNASDIIDHFATNADPTRNKTHTQWILGQYKKQNIRQEDAPRIHDALTNFEKYKGKLEKKDINSYKSLNDVEDAVASHLGQAASKKAEVRQIKAEGADLIHKDGDFSIHHIKTESAAQLYGKGTMWCTAADKNCMFADYNKQGKLFVIHSGDRKFQYHRESNQFMDEKDKEIGNHDFNSIKDKLHTAWDKHPEIAPKYNSAFDWKYGNKSSDDISKALNDSDKWVRRTAILHPNATSEHISKALNDSDAWVRRYAIENLNATPEHISKALNDSDAEVRRAAKARLK